MKVIGVIPARFGAQRLPGKPLVQILGKPLIAWVIEGVQQSQKLHEVLVATDHLEIAQVAEKMGVEAVMTASELPSGTDRVNAAIAHRQGDIIVNIQGDEPLIKGGVIDQLVEPFFEDKNLEMATLGKEMTSEALAASTTAKIVLNQLGEALYFSRFAIPYTRLQPGEKISGCLKHIGLYAYRRAFLEKLCAHDPVEIEINEGLEQLRALYLGARIRVVKVDHESWGVDQPEDVEKIESLLKARG